MTAPTNSRDDLSALLDEELDADALAALEAELAEDEALRSELLELRSVTADLRGLAEVRAPGGFLAAVMARVDAGEGIGEPLFAPVAVAGAVAPGSTAPTVEASSPEDAGSLPDNVARLPFWIRGPAIAAAAAALLVGIGFALRDPGLGSPPAAEELAFGRAESGPASARPTGLLRAEDDEGGDGLAALEAPETPSPEEQPSPLRLKPAEAERVAVGGAGVTPASPSRSSGLREVAGRGRAPAGVVYVAPFEGEEMDAQGAVDSELAGEDAMAVVDEAAAPAADARPEIDVDVDTFEGPAVAMAAAPTAKSATRAAADRAPTEGLGRLTTGEADTILRLRDAIAAKGWSLRFLSPAEGPVTLSDAHPEQVLELRIPAGSEAAAQLLLERHGNFRLSATPEAAADGGSRLRLTVVYRR